MNKQQKIIIYRIFIAAISAIVCLLFDFDKNIEFIILFSAYITVGYDILFDCIKNFFHGIFFDENLLMTIASLGAFALGENLESVCVMLFFRIGELLEDFAVDNSEKNIKELINIRPDYANLITEDGIVKVFPDDVDIDDIITVYPGEKIPLDGVITDGETSVDTVCLTGESVPVDKFIGDRVLCGCINLSGLINIKVEKKFSDSSVSKIIKLTEESSKVKSKSESFISAFAEIYTPIVVFLAFTVGVVIPGVLCFVFKEDCNFSVWLYRALSFLVICCPCSLVISIPLSFFACMGGCSRKGILVKGSCFIERLSKLKCIVFDKTGTVTKGNFEVVGVNNTPYEKEKTLEFAAICESYSSHPIAKSIIKYYNKDIDKNRVKNIKEIRGKGITAEIDGKTVIVGNEAIMTDNNIDCLKSEIKGTVIHVAVDGEYFGNIVICDTVKPTSEKTIIKLKKLGVKKAALLTGDKYEVAEDVSSQIGIDEFYAQLLPEEKVCKYKEISLPFEGKSAFAGDGINDAPVIALSDVGIAMGGLGSDAAVEAADVVIMDDNPYKIAEAVKISKKCLRIVYENIIFSILVKIISLILITVGVFGMWVAVISDVGVMIVCVFNSIRTLRNK